jgi:hypothetical protein
MRIFAYSTAMALALAAFAAPAQSADYNDYRYGERYERGYEVPVPVPQYGYERGPREYRVIVYPVKPRYYDYEQSRYPAPYPNGGYYNGAPYGASNSIPNGNGYGGNGYEQGYRDGVNDATRGPGAYGAQPYGAQPYARAEYEGGVLLPPAPVGPPRRAVYSPSW